MSVEQPVNPAQVFEDYFAPALFKPWAAKLLEDARIQDDERVLDLACATGTVARQVAAILGPRGTVDGLDFSPAMLAVARSLPAPQSPAITWTEGSASDLPYADGSFDVVLSQQGLQFFPERTKAAKEIHRVLRPGGRLVASVWHGTDAHPVYRSLFQAVAGKLGVPFSEVSVPFSLGDRDELTTYVGSGGFSDIEVRSQELDVRFKSPDRFVQLSAIGAAAVIPAFTAMDPDTRSRMAEEIAVELDHEISGYVKGDELVFPTALNVVIARK